MNLLWLIPVFPALAFGAIILFTNRNQALSRWLAWIGIGLSWVISWNIFFQSWRHFQEWATHPYRLILYRIPTGGEDLELGFMVDPLTAIMLFMVPFVCLMIFIYSKGYMEGDPRYSRFFAYISLFACGMLGLVISDNLLTFLIFWEIMGLCSYLLIGFWFEKESAMKAGLKAFLTTRVGDVIMLLGILFIYSQTGTLSFHRIFTGEALHHLATATVNLPLFGPAPVATLIALLIFGGAVGKSAQFPLHVWLPDAMEGPTPVSALIHAATMVSAGVYLVARTFPLFSAVEHGTQLGAVAFIGAFTAFMSATIAIAQNDIKRVLAYSTISQLGYMIAALGVGAYVAAVFHLITHAFFKALLFLGAGSVIIGSHHEMDMMNMGGLRKKMPITFITFLVGTLALAGFPGFSGFWSKDEILAHAWHEFTGGHFLFWPFFVWLLCTLSAFITAFYMSRQVCLTFLGNPRGHHAEHAHETSPSMLVPLIILALFAASLGFAGVPEEFPALGEFFGGSPIHHFLGTILPEHGFESTPLNWTVMLISSLAAVGGLFLGWLVYGLRPLLAGQPDPLERLGGLYILLKNKYYVDEFYRDTVIRFTVWLSGFFFRIDDMWIVDPIVDGVGNLGRAFSEWLRHAIDEPVVDGAVNGVGHLSAWAGQQLRLIQTGRVQNYLLVALLTVLMLLGLYSILGI
ncbi:MAG: NADH-quinone oxidoreductase subunit L [Anaerolineae bacterium]